MQGWLHHIICVIGVFSALCLGACWDIDCGDRLLEDRCKERVKCTDAWVVTRFNQEEDDWACKRLGSWMEPNLDMSLSVSVETENVTGANAYATMMVSQNDGKGTAGWTGGGLVLELVPEQSSVDLSCFDSLVFSVHTSTSELRNYLKVKLEDASGANRPETTLAGYGLGTAVGWYRVAVPLSRFTGVSNQNPLRQDQLTRIVWGLVNDGSAPRPVDGVVWLDEIRFVTR